MPYTDLASFDVGRVYDGALRILESVGVEVANPHMRRTLGHQFAAKGNRVLIPRQLVQAHLDEYRLRRRSAAQEAESGSGANAAAGAKGASVCQGWPPDPIVMRSSPLNCCWIDPVDGRTKPVDTAAAVANTKLLQKFVADGAVQGSVAGIPQDVAGAIQYVMAQYLACVYTPNPGPWGIFPSDSVLRYCMVMGEVMGFGLGILTEMISPLKLIRQSVDLAVKHYADLEWIHNDPMPILGVTAPADWHMAWAQSVAENLAVHVIFRSCGMGKVGIGSFRLFVPNPSTTMTYFSSPLHATALLTRRKLRWELLGERVDDGELLLVTSKVPDAQAAAEKMAGFAFARAEGFRSLEGAGGLYMDEIWSPEQLVVDIELRESTNSAASHMAPAPALEEILATVEAGVGAGTYLASDLTLEHFYDFAWRPRLFDLRTRASWEEGQRPLLDKARRALTAMDSLPAYELEGGRRSRIEAILGAAKREAGA